MSEESITLLKSIDQSLRTLVVLTQKGAEERVKAAQAAPAARAAGTGIASDRDLDSEYGDPEVRAKDPRDWTGDTMLGRRFSECPAEYLDMVADRLDYFADQAETSGELTTKGKPAAPYKRLDAARARGWAARIRAGKGKTAKPTPGFAADTAPDDDVPF